MLADAQCWSVPGGGLLESQYDLTVQTGYSSWQGTNPGLIRDPRPVIGSVALGSSQAIPDIASIGRYYIPGEGNCDSWGRRTGDLPDPVFWEVEFPLEAWREHVNDGDGAFLVIQPHSFTTGTAPEPPEPSAVKSQVHHLTHGLVSGDRAGDPMTRGYAMGSLRLYV